LLNSSFDVIPDAANGLRKARPDDRLRGDPEIQKEQSNTSKVDSGFVPSALPE
jgi:hypothetical protein